MMQTDGRPPRGGRGLKWLIGVIFGHSERRPPRGGRGLKFAQLKPVVTAVLVAPLAGGVD